MIDLHTHSLLSDGALLPSELVRRAEAKGYNAIAITDHVDMSNIEFVIPKIVRACKILNKFWKIKALPGVEITHAPIEEIGRLVSYAKKHGAKIIIGHGETLSEPVLKGTNRAFIKAKVDILAHPGLISDSDVLLAKKNKVLLELTTRKGHAKTNKYVLKLARRYKAPFVLNNDAHEPKDLLSAGGRNSFIKSLGLTPLEISQMENNSVRKIKL